MNRIDNMSIMDILSILYEKFIAVCLKQIPERAVKACKDRAFK